MALANLSIYYTWKNIKLEHSSNKFKISAPTWNDTFSLPDGSYSIADIQDYFEFIIEKHENVPKLESFEVVLVHCNLVKNDYQHRSKVLLTFFPNKQFEQLINISPHSLTMMSTVNTEFSFVEVWFTDQSSKALEIEVMSIWHKLLGSH